MGHGDVVFGSHAALGVVLAIAIVLAPLRFVIGLLPILGLLQSMLKLHETAMIGPQSYIFVLHTHGTTQPATLSFQFKARGHRPRIQVSIRRNGDFQCLLGQSLGVSRVGARIR